MTIPSIRIIRILVVEDNPSRHIRIRTFCDAVGLKPIIAPSAGRALGILQRDAAEIAGVMLDHDLSESFVTETDLTMSGKDIVKAIMKYLSKRTPILVHSMNPTGSAQMTLQLESAGFPVTQIPMSKLNSDDFLLWSEEVTESWSISN